MLVQHRLAVHKNETLVVKQKDSDVLEMCDLCDQVFNNSEEKTAHYTNEHNKKSVLVDEISEVSTEYTINEFPEKMEKQTMLGKQWKAIVIKE